MLWLFLYLKSGNEISPFNLDGAFFMPAAEEKLMTISKKLVRLSEVLTRTGYSKAWIYKLIAQGRFPQSVKLGPRSIAFVESEIDEWIDQRIAESRSEVA